MNDFIPKFNALAAIVNLGVLIYISRQLTIIKKKVFELKVKENRDENEGTIISHGCDPEPPK
jgi:hypothetical protein